MTKRRIWVRTFSWTNSAVRLALILIDIWAITAIGRAAWTHWPEISPFLNDIAGIALIAIIASIPLVRFTRWWKD